MAGLKLTDFVKTVHADSLGKSDYIEKASNLKMDSLGRLTTRAENEEHFTVKFNEWGLAQTLGRMEVPGLREYGKYLMEKEETYRLSNIFNFHLDQTVEKKGDKEWLIRTKNDVCRACLSDRYSIIDNEDIIHSIYETFKDENIEVVGNSIDHTYMNLRLKMTEIQLNAGTEQNKDPLFLGVHVLNSEVGASSVIIYLIIYREVCTNGLVREISRGGGYKQRHIINPNDTQSAIAEKFANVLREGIESLELFASSKDKKVSKPEKVIEEIVNRERLPKEMTERVVKSYLEEEDPTEYGILNAFTRSAREMNFVDRLEVEKLAGKLLSEGINS